MWVAQVGIGFVAGVVACWLLKGSLLAELHALHAKADRIIAAVKG